MIRLPSLKNSLESLTARLNRISQLLLTDGCLISGSFMARIAITWSVPLTVLKAWLRLLMLFTQALIGAAAHAKTLFAALEPALKQWWIYHQKAWKGCGCNCRSASFTKRVLSISKFRTMKSTTLNKKRARIVLSALDQERESGCCGSFRDFLLCLICRLFPVAEVRSLLLNLRTMTLILQRYNVFLAYIKFLNQKTIAPHTSNRVFLFVKSAWEKLA